MKYAHLPIAYFAGLIDGEAYVAVLVNNKKQSMNPRPMIQISMTDYAPLEACAERFGGSIRDVKPHKGTMPHHKRVWSWRISGNRAKAAAKMIRPFSLVKSAPLDKILAWEPRDNRRYITIDGITRFLKEWAAIYGINYNTVQLRLAAGWSPETALSTPLIRGKRKDSERASSDAPSFHRKAKRPPVGTGGR